MSDHNKYYAVASGRNVGVYDNWDDCKDQVNRYSHNNYKKFDTPDKAYDFVDQHSSGRNSSGKAITYGGGSNQVATRDNYGEASGYQRTTCMEGRNSVVYRQETYRSGKSGNEHFTEKNTLTRWKNK